MYRPGNAVPYAAVEADLMGVYQKYSVLDHTGRIDMRASSDVEQKCCALQHWIFQWTSGNMLLTRLEGIQLSSEQKKWNEMFVCYTFIADLFQKMCGTCAIFIYPLVHPIAQRTFLAIVLKSVQCSRDYLSITNDLMMMMMKQIFNTSSRFVFVLPLVFSAGVNVATLHIACLLHLISWAKLNYVSVILQVLTLRSPMLEYQLNRLG